MNQNLYINRVSYTNSHKGLNKHIRHCLLYASVQCVCAALIKSKPTWPKCIVLDICIVCRLRFAFFYGHRSNLDDFRAVWVIYGFF